MVPEECVSREQLLGSTCEIEFFNNTMCVGKLCNVNIHIHGKVFSRRAVTQPGETLNWTACLNLPFTNREEWSFIADEMDKKADLAEEKTLYLPPELKNGALLSGVLVSEGTLVDPEDAPVVDDSLSHVAVTDVAETEVVAESVESGEDKVGEELVELRETEQILGEGKDASVLVEGDGVSLGGSADQQGTQDLTVEGISCSIPRTALAEATKGDDMLQNLYKLATLEKKGYYLKDGILYRTRLDDFGSPREQISLPVPYRQKCLILAHSNFGHQGRNKMTDLIKPYFHWPSITRDCLTHVIQCDVCQRMDKTTPRPNKMQLREMASVPFESVAMIL